MIEYSEKLQDHFLHPRNVGTLPEPDGVGSVGDPSCGDYLEVSIRVAGERIAGIAFRCKGCPAAIATASAMTEMAKGMHVDEAALLSGQDVSAAVGGVPDGKEHCSNLAAAALGEAIWDWVTVSIQRRKTVEEKVERRK